MRLFCIWACCLLFVAAGRAETNPLPKGLMLNLDFQHAQQGLIPNRSFYPLYVPQGDLVIQELLGENMLVFMNTEGLSIPHSSLIQPDGSEWIVTLQFGAYPEGGDGMLLSQCNDECGYAIYLKDGSPRAVVRTGNCAMILKEDPASGLTDARKQLCTVELRIMKDTALLTINRKRAAIVTIEAPLNGTEDMPIRLGAHHQLPSVVKNISGVKTDGFFGAISGLKIWRQ